MIILENKRLLLPDLLKGFAVFMIVPVHILEFFINAPGRESLFGKILLFLGGPVCVPVFMITMGYFVGRFFKVSPYKMAGCFHLPVSEVAGKKYHGILHYPVADHRKHCHVHLPNAEFIGIPVLACRNICRHCTDYLVG